MNKVLSSVIEAWGEIKINKARFILSLIGVTVAVWAMATVLALGGMVISTDEYFRIIFGNRPGLLTFAVTHTDGDSSQSENWQDPFFAAEVAADIAPASTQSESASLVEDPQGHLTTKFGVAARQTASDLEVTHWSRLINLTPNVRTSNWSSACDFTFEDCSEKQVELNGVDPIYFDFLAKSLEVGRLLKNSDALLQMNPVVINEKLWNNLGSPPLQHFPRMIVEGDPGLTLTVVGVVKNQTPWENNLIFMHYDGLVGAQPRLKTSSPINLENGVFKILVPIGEEQIANDVITATLQSRLGPDFEVGSYWHEQPDDSGAGQRAIITTIVSAIGGIVIMLGAFGLLTVSIVTVRQRIREIGIRRAMGASAKRVFFSVFLESVVATTAAGFAGVILSILTIRLTPQSWLDLPIPVSSIPYPMSAALLGVLIAATVGALAGIIPASIAVRVKPIDAIRY